VSAGWNLEGRRILVTGATRGIGSTIALDLARRGASVVGVGRNVQERARTGHQAGDEPVRGSLDLIGADLSRPAEAASVVTRAVATLGGLDVLVNNAASHGRLQPILSLSLEDWDSVLATNLTAPFLLSQAAAGVMAESAGGVILNILAIQSSLPARGYGPYAASKGGLDALTRQLAVELADFHIRVNGLVLGAVYSDSVRAALPEIATSEDLEAVPQALDAGAPTLVGRMGRPSDVAGLVAFLVSDDASFLTGSLVVADGGRSLNRAPDPLIPRLDKP
jgi:NAD(P)-dependent dehydrogenase (short-subunit alcohol dehydrogenase family)